MHLVLLVPKCIVFLDLLFSPRIRNIRNSGMGKTAPMLVPCAAGFLF